MQLQFQQSFVEYVEAPQFQFIDRVVGISVASLRQGSQCKTVQKTGDSPGAVLGMVGTRPCCATTGCMVQTVQKLWKYRKCSTLTGWSMFLLLQFIDKVGRPCDLAVTELMGFFSAFCAFFALLRVVPELSASFSSGRALDDEEFFVIEGSGMALTPGVSPMCQATSRCQLMLSVCGMPSPKQQQQQQQQLIILSVYPEIRTHF